MTSGAIFCVITRTATALRGCTGIGIRYLNAVTYCIAPNITSTLAL